MPGSRSATAAAAGTHPCASPAAPDQPVPANGLCVLAPAHAASDDNDNGQSVCAMVCDEYASEQPRISAQVAGASGADSMIEAKDESSEEERSGDERPVGSERD